MEKTFLTEMRIENVRHLHNIKIPLSREEKKHLILTGKNGSGKTSVLESLSAFLKYLVSNEYEDDVSKERVAQWKDKLPSLTDAERINAHRYIHTIEANARRYWNDGCTVSVNSSRRMREKYKKGQFILAYLRDSRQMRVDVPTDFANVDLKQVYEIEEHPAKNIGKYLLNLKVTQAFAKLKGDTERDQEIERWFSGFTQVLREIYKEQSLELVFDIDTHLFTIHIPGRLPFTLDCMSMGYAAVFDIVGDLMMRMDSQHSYALEGIVLIDEVETHLHVELQRAIVPILTRLFPNLQFVLTTHSPFILSATENAVIYDLQNESYIDEGLAYLPYDAIMECYFDTSLYSQQIEAALNEYRSLLAGGNIAENIVKIRSLEQFLDQVPKLMAPQFALEYKKIRQEANR